LVAFCFFIFCFRSFARPVRLRVLVSVGLSRPWSGQRLVFVIHRPRHRGYPALGRLRCQSPNSLWRAGRPPAQRFYLQ
jgi:hypothetical protein